MRAHLRLILTLTSLAACLPPPLADCTDYACLETSQADTSGASSPTTGGAPIHTVTGDDADTTDATTAAEPATDPAESGDTQTTTTAANEAPTIYGFKLSKEKMLAAGEVELQLDASADVVEVDVWYGDALLATLPIASFPYVFDVTSQAMCDGLQAFTVTVRDAEGLTDTDLAELLCQLPAPGSEVYTSTFPGMVSSSGAAIAALPDGAVIVAGQLDGRMALWRLAPDGNLLPNWPKTITGWTLTDLGGEASTATAVALDPLGAIVVAGNTESGVTTRRYLARLSEKGELLWEDAGLKDGEDIAGAAVAVTGEIAAAGSLRTNLPEPNPTYDSSTWFYPTGYHPSQGPVAPDVFGQPDTDPVPQTDNERSERARAVVAGDDGFTVFGEREYLHELNDEPYTRATAQRYTPAGERDGMLWTSTGTKFLHEAVLAATATDSGFIAVGWCRHATPNSLRQTCVQEFDMDSHWIGSYAEPSPMHAEARAVAQDREHKAVLGGFLTKPGQVDAWIFASRGADQPLAWSQKHDAGAWEFASGIGCDLWGHCTWVGTTTVDGAMALIVSQRQP